MTDRREPIDRSVLDNLLEMTGGEQAFVDELIATYLEDGAGQLGALRSAAAGTVVEGLVRPAHSLKSNSASVGALGLAELCRALEHDARAGDVPAPGERVATIAEEFERVQAALGQARAEP
jgi:two-component system, sensor histidine kinase and response regulator